MLHSSTQNKDGTRLFLLLLATSWKRYNFFAHTKMHFSQILIANRCGILRYRHIKMLIKHHDYCTDMLGSRHNKSPLHNVQFYCEQRHWIKYDIKLSHIMPYSVIGLKQCKLWFTHEVNISLKWHCEGGLGRWTLCRSRPQCLQMSFSVTVFEFVQEFCLCKPTIASDDCLDGLRWSCRWRNWMWRAWAEVVWIYCEIIWNYIGDVW